MTTNGPVRKTGIRTLRVSAADVARTAGVSPATVSYVFNGRPGVSEEMRERILAIAKEMGYPLDRHRSLDREHTRVLGLILTDISNPFYSDVSAGTIDVARSHGYEVFVAHTQESSQMLATVVKTMITRRVDGVLLTSLHTDDGEVIRTLRRAAVPFIQVSRRIPELQADFIGFDETAVADEIFQHVVEHGYTDVAVITGPQSSSSSAARAAAYAAAAQRLGVPLPRHRRFTAYLTAYGGHRVAQHLIDAHDIPRAIVCGSDAIASGVIGTLREHELRVPDDVAVTGVDGVFPGLSMLAELTTITLPRRQLAERAVEQLIRRVNGVGGPAMDAVLPHSVRIGTSCGCLRPLIKDRSSPTARNSRTP